MFLSHLLPNVQPQLKCQKGSKVSKAKKQRAGLLRLPQMLITHNDKSLPKSISGKSQELDRSKQKCHFRLQQETVKLTLSIPILTPSFSRERETQILREVECLGERKPIQGIHLGGGAAVEPQG